MVTRALFVKITLVFVALVACLIVLEMLQFRRSRAWRWASRNSVQLTFIFRFSTAFNAGVMLGTNMSWSRSFIRVRFRFIENKVSVSGMNAVF